MTISTSSFFVSVLYLLLAGTEGALRGAHELAASTAAAAATTKTMKPRKGQHHVECRVTINTMMEELLEGGEVRDHAEDIVCLPINEQGLETDGVFPIQLPEEIVEANRKAIASGTLYLKIDGAIHVEDESLAVHDEADFVVYNADTLPSHLRRLEQEQTHRRRLSASGPKSVAIVRITTADNRVTDFTASQLEDGLFGDGYNNDGVTMSNQYKQCSSGKITFNLKEPVIEIKLGLNLNQYTVDSMQTEVQKTLKAQRGLSSMQQLADFSMFIMPEGMGFTAGAPVNHWRSSYHNRWGLSLAGTLHELGHNLGLGHAWEDGQNYQDYSGYMAAGGTDTNLPLTCFNGYNMHALGWFDEQTTSINSASMASNKAELYKISAFVDVDRAENYEPVLVDIDDSALVLQYNRRSRHNIGTREKADMLTITAPELRGQAASDMRAGLDVGEQYASNGLIIKVCSRVYGNGSSPDALIVSVGKNTDACGQTWSPPNDSGTFTLNMAVTETAPRTTII